MNPLIISQILVALKKVFTNKIVLVVVFVLFLYLIFKKKVKDFVNKRSEKKFDEKATEDPNRVALGFRNAANPSGYSWMIDWDGTDEVSFERLARKMKDQGIINEVTKAYQDKYHESLLDRAAKELGGEELKTFDDIIS